MITDFALRKRFRVTDDRGDAYAAFQEFAFVADPFAGIASTFIGKVVVAFWVPACVVFNGDTFVVLFGVAVVATENDDCVFALTRFFEFVDDTADLGIHGGDDASVGSARHFEVWVGIFEISHWLLRIVGKIEGNHHEEWIFSFGPDIVDRLVDDHVGVVFFAAKDLLVVVIEIVISFAMEEVVPVVVDKTGEMTKVLVESLIERTVADFCTEVPLAEQGCLVA